LALYIGQTASPTLCFYDFTQRRVFSPANGGAATRRNPSGQRPHGGSAARVPTRVSLPPFFPSALWFRCARGNMIEGWGYIFLHAPLRQCLSGLDTWTFAYLESIYIIRADRVLGSA
jgi:hypothetical protein